jgi:hypothetical protein
MTDQWYLAREKQKFGPYSTEQLKQFAAQGQVVPTDMLLKEGEGKWVAASTVDGLFAPQVVPPPLPAVSPEAEKGSTPFVVPDIRQLATSGSLPPALVGVGAVLAPPLGLYCVWKHPRWTVQQKWVWTGAAALVLLVGLFFIPRVVLPLALLSGCALMLSLVWTDASMTVEQKRRGTLVSGLVCILGLVLVVIPIGGSGASGSAKVRAFDKLLDKVLEPQDSRIDSEERDRQTKEAEALWKAYKDIPLDPKKSPDEAKAIVDLYLDRVEKQGHRLGGTIGMQIVNEVENLGMALRTQASDR